MKARFYLIFPSERTTKLVSLGLSKNLERSSKLRISERKSKWKEQKNGGGGCGFEFWLLSFYPLSNIRRQKSSAIQKISGVSLNNTSRISSSHVAKGIPYIISHITPPSVHLSRQKSTKHGLEVNPFSMDWGIVIPHKTPIRRHWPSLGCLRIVLYCAKRMRPGA